MATPCAAERLDPLISTLVEANRGKTVVFGGIASGSDQDDDGVSLFHERCSSSGLLVCKLTPRQLAGQKLDAVVVSGTSRAGTLLQVIDCNPSLQGGLCKVESVRPWRPADRAAAPLSRVPIQALMETAAPHGQMAGIVWSAGADAATGELRAPVRALGEVRCDRRGAILTETRLPAGAFLQAEVLSARRAGENVEGGLRALARERRDDGRRRAAATAGGTLAGDGLALATSPRGGGGGGGARATTRAGDAAAVGGLLFSCLARSAAWYREHGMAENFEAAAFAMAFPGRALAGFLASGEIFGEYAARPARAAAALSEEVAAADGRAKSVRELKEILERRGVDVRHCIEKSDLVRRYTETRELGAEEERKEEKVDFMHGFTAVYAISSSLQWASQQ